MYVYEDTRTNFDATKKVGINIRRTERKTKS